LFFVRRFKHCTCAAFVAYNDEYIIIATGSGNDKLNGGKEREREREGKVLSSDVTC
jgi:thioredoxin reductase